MSEKLERFVDIDWSQIAAAPERPIDLLLREGIRVFIKVRGDSEVVYSYTSALLEEGGRSVSVGGFVEGAMFLRLGNRSLAEIALAGTCHASEFSEGGLFVPQPYEFLGIGPSGLCLKEPLPIGVAKLEWFYFDRAVIVDKKTWEFALSNSHGIIAPSPEPFRIQIEVGERDLFVSATDLSALRQERQKESGDASLDIGLPIAIYLLYQAAYRLNQNQLTTSEEVLNWLKRRSGTDGEMFAGNRGKFAAKLVPKELDRARGRKDGARPFNMSEFNQWVVDPKKYEFPCVGEGLKIVIAVSEWWCELEGSGEPATRLVLAERLYRFNFDWQEVDHLVRLIAGAKLSKSEKKEFTAWVDNWERTKLKPSVPM